MAQLSYLDVPATESGRITPAVAGLRSIDHYRYRLPRWRFVLREKCLPLIRWETPYLAYLQEHVRSPALDTYFAFSANLGTLTFFMSFLPTMFWFGYTEFGRGIVHVLAAGVFLSGMIKDLLCLPRPLSPPLHRITMSGSAALEYGFPSTHSTNAISVALYSIFTLRASDSVTPKVQLCLEVAACIYTASILLGRIYCGMHGFMDVIAGTLLGALLAIVRWNFRHTIDGWIFSDSVTGPLLIIITMIVLVRIHPEPADPCPCFDDGVAFAAVIMGVDLGIWHFAKTPFSSSTPVPGTVPYQFGEIGIVKTALRILLGLVLIFAWREVMKPTFHYFLPPLFRFIEHIGLSLPRRHFIKASEYKRVPRIKEDTLPQLNEIPAIVASIRRGRSDSVGPQSQADAYETLAYRERKRRESIDSANGTAAVRSRTGTTTVHRLSNPPPFTPADMYPTSDKWSVRAGDGASSAFGSSASPPATATYTSPVSSPIIDHFLPPPGYPSSTERYADDSDDDEASQREVFQRIDPPRVRYDVEVVTRLFVYSGIALLAVEGGPILFELVGLGVGRSATR